MAKFGNHIATFEGVHHVPTFFDRSEPQLYGAVHRCGTITSKEGKAIDSIIKKL
jgi:hypothetical protein